MQPIHPFAGQLETDNNSINGNSLTHSKSSNLRFSHSKINDWLLRTKKLSLKQQLFNYGMEYPHRAPRLTLKVRFWDIYGMSFQEINYNCGLPTAPSNAKSEKHFLKNLRPKRQITPQPSRGHKLKSEFSQFDIHQFNGPITEKLQKFSTIPGIS